MWESRVQVACLPEGELRSGSVPARALALLLVKFLNNLNSAGTTEFADGSEHGVDEGDGRGIGSAEINRVNRSKKNLLAGARRGQR
jgi:hypothetical protein